MKTKQVKYPKIKFATIDHAGIVKHAVKRAKMKGPKMRLTLDFDREVAEKFDANVKSWRDEHGLTMKQASDAYMTHLVFCELAKVELAQMELEQAKKNQGIAA